MEVYFSHFCGAFFSLFRGREKPLSEEGGGYHTFSQSGCIIYIYIYIYMHMAVWGTLAKQNKNTNLRVNDISIFFLKKKIT